MTKIAAYQFLSVCCDIHIVSCGMVCWQNYNKSRIHSSRGARDIEITLNGALIFVGEIAQAAGDVVGTSECFGDVRIVCLN